MTIQAGNNRIRIGIGIFLLLSGFYLFTSGGHIYVKDGGAMHFMTTSMIEHGWFDVPVNANTLGGKTGPDGNYYTPFGILQPVLAIPMVWFGRCLAPYAGANYLSSSFATWMNAFTTAGIFVYLALFYLRLGVPRGYALGTTLLAGISTPFWVYSGSFFSEPLASLGIIGAAYHLRRHHDLGALKDLITAALLAASILLVRPLSGAALPALFLYLVLLDYKQNPQKSGWRAMKPYMIFVGIAGIGILLLLYYNFLRFGSIIETGYDKLPSGQPRNFTLPAMTGLKILLLSPGKSLFIFSPLVIPAIWGSFIAIRRNRNQPESILSLAMMGLFVSILCRWFRVEGGVTWGPRLLLPAVPVFLLMLTPLLQPRRYIARRIILLLAGSGLIVQFLGISVNYAAFIARHYDEYFDNDTGVYQFHFNPFPGHVLEMWNNFEEIRTLEPRDPAIAADSRAVFQNNYRENLDLWWIHFWRDRVNLRFIWITAGIQLVMFCAGALLLHRTLRRT